ncbi:MAG: hypothetical protein ACI84C_002444 [Flavobacteriales bacterium]|jgi:hypothetical protein
MGNTDPNPLLIRALWLFEQCGQTFGKRVVIRFL